MAGEELDDNFQMQDELTVGMGTKRSVFINRLRRMPEETHFKPTDNAFLPAADDDEALLPEREEIDAENLVFESDSDERIGFEDENEDVDFEEPETDMEVDLSESMWVSDEAIPQEEIRAAAGAQPDKSPEKLNDTQPIKIMPMDPELVIQEAEKAVNGGNFQYALKLVKPLIDQNIELDAVCRYLENVVEQHPEKTSYLLLLGEVYTRMSNNEKALEVFRKAQNLISL